MIKDTETLKRDVLKQLAFMKTATHEEFERAKKEGGGSYGYISGDYAEAKQRANKNSDSLNLFTHDEESTNYFSERLSPTAVQAYESCLEKNTDTPGLRIWLKQRQGRHYTFRAMWVGNNTVQPEATFDEEATVTGGKLIQAPKTWVKGRAHNLLVEGSGNEDIVIALSVGGQSNSIVLLKDPPSIKVNYSDVTSSPYDVRSTLGNNCSGGQKVVCIQPSAPERIFTGDAAIIDAATNRPGNYSASMTTQTPSLACATIIQSTSACERQGIATGRIWSREMFLTVD